MSRLEPGVHQLLNKEVLKALQKKLIYTVSDFVKADTQQIVKTARLTFREVLAVKKCLLKQFSAVPVNGYDRYKITVSNTAIISTGISRVDDLLGGGFFTGNIYELCGLPASGKTCFTLTVMKNLLTFMQQKIFFLDTKNDFSALKMRSMLGRLDQQALSDYLSKIIIYRVNTKFELINCFYNIKNLLVADDLKLRFIIVDSLPAVLLNTNEPSTNNLHLNYLANIMRYIAVEHHLVILVTNLITTWNDGDFKNQQEATENIACGKYWCNIPNTRLKIEKTENQASYTVSVLKSENCSNNIGANCNIVLSEEGFS